MPTFKSALDKYLYSYEKNWVSEVQLRLCVKLSILTETEYKVIINKERNEA
ncbi:XkdX family protein [Paenibacillus timonensis]|uniref:XkdX family protein n=1 Tax=Paenibacillus timonensis TaxID=225915 RepID=UPI003F9DC149